MDKTTSRKPGKRHAETSLARQMAIIGMLPLKGSGEKGKTRGEIEDALKAKDFRASRRTVERDLEQLWSGRAGLSTAGLSIVPHDETASRKRWFAPAQSQQLQLRQVKADDALIVLLAAEGLKPFLPSSTHDALAAHLSATEIALRRGGRQEILDYRKKIASYPEDYPMLAGQVDVMILREITTALLKGDQLAVAYQKRNAQAASDYRLHPVGLIKTDYTLKLLAHKEERGVVGKTTQTFLLHRMKTARHLQSEPVASGLPSLAEAVDKGGLNPNSSGKNDVTIQMTLRFAVMAPEKTVLNKLRETPFSADQRIRDLGGDVFELTATVLDGYPLHRKLMSLANEAEVIAPPSLRQTIAHYVRKAAALYDTI